ncbi:hypothetical protein [Vibrio nigripulchritudo]|uniref:hypothetical protein n=1 Tax=Vibrio nigripulchritudo TaxID=28173 RepID=UPI0005FA3BCE|nr:hypothetical protein [Vibrio nigripulchritudo]
MKALWNGGIKLGKDILRVYWTLLKIMVPTLIVVKLLDSVGGTEWLAILLSPFMEALGLPQEWGLVWAVAILTNIYTAMAVFYEVAGQADFTGAQITVLGLLILFAHSLPMEGAVAKAAGVPWWMTIVFRVGGGLVIGWLAHSVYQAGGWQQSNVNLLWQPEPLGEGWGDWAMDQLKMLVSIFFIISVLMMLLKLLRVLGIEKLLHLLLTPLMKGLTIGKEATNITIIGITLGLSFGAGLLIDEVKQGKVSKRDTLIVVCFLGLCHSIIEDTLLILLLGADIYAVLWGRLIFSIVLIAIWARLLSKPDDTYPSPVTHP